MSHGRCRRPQLTQSRHEGLGLLRCPVVVDYLLEFLVDRGQDLRRGGAATDHGVIAKGLDDLTPHLAARNPADHVILSRKPIDGLEGAEKEAAIEAERKHPRWRVLLPCECAVKALHKYDPNFYASEDRAIMFKLVYEEKAK